jgi:formamidopyrimidine-DNA glycosylase
MPNARRLGRIRLVDQPLTDPPISRLGFDALIDLPRSAQLAEKLAQRHAAIKAVLLDQSLAAGVGNWIADEVLYQARIDPRRKASDLRRDEVTRLRQKLREIIRKAVAVDADKSRFPRTWLFHARWGKDSQARTLDGQPIKFIVVGGRTTAYVPALQR